jgi:hypothetical protein
MEDLTMPNTSEATATITRLITTGTTDRELVAAAAQRFPELSTAEFSVALQTVTALAERQVARRR